MVAPVHALLARLGYMIAEQPSVGNVPIMSMITCSQVVVITGEGQRSARFFEILLTGATGLGWSRPSREAFGFIVQLFSDADDP